MFDVIVIYYSLTKTIIMHELTYEDKSKTKNLGLKTKITDIKTGHSKGYHIVAKTIMVTYSF